MKQWFGSIIMVLAVGLGPTSACAPTQGAGPTLEEAVAEQRQWPACITQQMQERAFACPVRPAPEQRVATCTAQPVAPWPPPAPTLDPSAELAHQMAGTSKALDRAQMVRAKAASGGTATDGGDWTKAQRAFERLQRNPRADQVSRAYAGYELGLILLRLGRSDLGLDALEAGMRLALQAQPSLRATALIESARVALISAAATVGDVGDARVRFRALIDRDDERELSTMLHALADALAGQGKLSLAAELLSDLAQRDALDGCTHQAKAVRAHHARGLKLPTAQALDVLLEHYYAISPDDSRRSHCGAATAQALIQIGNEWHAESLGSPARLGTRDPQTIHLASQLYRAVIGTFTQRQLDDWAVCASLGRLALRRANLLRAQGDWEKCGPAYDVAIRLDPQAAASDEAAFSAVVCRQNAWTDMKSAQADRPPKQRIESSLKHTKDWRQLLRAIHRYLCTATTPQTNHPNYANSALTRAQALHDGGALWEAAVAFRLVAFEHSKGNAGGQAARRYAEVMEPLAADDACRRELSIDLERLDAMYCRPRSAAAAECQGLGDVLTRLGADGLRL